MKAKLYIILTTLCLFTSCNKSKSAQSIYDSTPSIIYSMTPEEESERMKDVFGCYGLTLDKTTPKEARKIMKKQNADFEGPYYSNEYQIYESYTNISPKLERTPNIAVYRSEIKHSYDKSTYIYSLFVNDTLSQICLNVFDNSYYLEKDLVKKYGEGNGEKKDAEFGLDKEGKINLKDYVPGYEFRQWQNDKIVIDWPNDRYTYYLSKNFAQWKPTVGTNDNIAIYTSKKMAPRILHYLKKSFDKYKSKKEEMKNDRINNL